jgi:hypothetical protein
MPRFLANSDTPDHNYWSQGKCPCMGTHITIRTSTNKN